MPSPTPVTVNFNVNIDASGNIEVFGAPPVTYDNKIVPSVMLPVNALYDADASGEYSGLIEFWEPSNQLGNINVQLANTAELGAVGAYQTASKVLAKGLQRILVDSLDCINATPFSGYIGTDYTSNRDFGRLALSAHAHDIFGHVAATAAITNDQAFMAAMLSVSDASVADGQTAAQRYDAWTKLSMVANPVEQWDAAQSKVDANLAVALVKALVGKGLSGSTLLVSNVNAITNPSTDGTLANIVRQVIGQDASRAMGQDNNMLAPDLHQYLRFYEGDKVVVNVTLQAPALTVATGQRDANVFATPADRNYSIELTLGPKEGSAPAPAPAPPTAPAGNFPITITSVDRTTGNVTYTSTEDIFIQAVKNSIMSDGLPFASGVGSGLTRQVYGINTSFGAVGDSLFFSAPNNPSDVRSNTVIMTALGAV